jgi:signal transduction histidine kinase
MPDLAPTHATYEAFLRSRWPSRTRQLALHALLGTPVFLALDWFFSRRLPAPPSLATLATMRLPLLTIPVVGWLLQRLAPSWRHLPLAVTSLSVAWTWAAVIGYDAAGLDGTVIQAITLFACLVTAASVMPLTTSGRLVVLALMALGDVVFDLVWRETPPGAHRVVEHLAVLTFAAIQVVVFQSFAAARQKGVLLRHQLQQAVQDLEASRRRAAAAVDEVGRLASEVAHQVNNPLSAVKVNVAWLAGEGTQPAHAEERAEVKVESLAAIDRIAAIVQTLKRRAVDQQEAIGEERPEDRAVADP